MDIQKKLEDLVKQRDLFVSQAEKQIAYLDGQIALLREMLEEEKNAIKE